MTDPATRESVVAELVQESAPQVEEAPAVEAPAPEVEPEEPPAEEIESGDDQPLDPDAPETASEGEGEDVEPEAPAIEAPHFWSAEAKARFAELPPDLQLVVLENEKAASKATTQKLEEAALARKAAEAERQVLAGLNERIVAAAEKAEASFADRWAGMTPEVWLKLSKDDPNKYVQLRAQFDAEQQAVQQAQTAKDAAAAIEREQWRNDQIESLKTLAPELVDPEKGQERLESLGAYLVRQGVREQDLPMVGALEMSVAWKAMKFDELQALKPALKNPPKAPVRPAAAPPASTSKEREIQRLRNRFAQTGAREDAVALMLAEEN